MSPKEFEELLKRLPTPPRELSPIEYVGVLSAVMLLLMVVATVLVLVPRWMKARAASDAATLEALRRDREKDLDRFSGDARAQREAAVKALDDIAKTHERAVDRIHARLDDVTGEIGALRIDVSEQGAMTRAECQRQGSETRLEVQRQAAAQQVETARLGCYDEPKARAAG